MEVPHPILQSAKRLERSETVERLERLERADPHDERSEAIERLERFERIVSPYTITLTALSPGTSTAFILYPFAFIPYPLISRLSSSPRIHYTTKNFGQVPTPSDS